MARSFMPVSVAEAIYAEADQGWRPLSDFVAHLALAAADEEGSEVGWEQAFRLSNAQEGVLMLVG